MRLASNTSHCVLVQARTQWALSCIVSSGWGSSTLPPVPARLRTPAVRLPRSTVARTHPRSPSSSAPTLSVAIPAATRTGASHPRSPSPSRSSGFHPARTLTRARCRAPCSSRTRPCAPVLAVGFSICTRHLTAARVGTRARCCCPPIPSSCPCSPSPSPLFRGRARALGGVIPAPRIRARARPRARCCNLRNSPRMRTRARRARGWRHRAPRTRTRARCKHRNHRRSHAPSLQQQRARVRRRMEPVVSRNGCKGGTRVRGQDVRSVSPPLTPVE